MRKRRRLNKKRLLIFGTLLLLIIAMTGVVLYGQLKETPDEKIARLRADSYETYRSGDFKEAIPKLKSYLTENSRDLDARNVLASSYAQTGNLEAALKETDVVLESRPTDGDTFYRAGLLAAQLGRDREAIEYFASAIGNKPGMLQHHYQLAEAHTKLKQYAQALLGWEQVLEMLPQDDKHRATIYGKIGNIYVALNLKTKAKRYFKKGLSINPDDALIKASLAKVGE